MSQLTWKRSALFLALAILLDLSGLHSASAQTAMSVNNNESTPMPGVGHDYVHFLSETVDPRNGSLSVQIQFPVPPSRGISIPFSINYDSNGVFHMLPTNPPGGVYAATDKAYLSENGWSYSAPLLSYYETFNSAKWKVQFGVQLYSTCYDLTDFIFTDPGGGRHSFYLSYLLPNQSDSSYCDQTTTPTKTFLSDTSDESGEYQAYIVQGNGYSPLHLYVASSDGTTYSFLVNFDTPTVNHDGSPSIQPTAMYSLPSSIEDRNGNQSGVGASGPGASGVNGIPIWVPLTYTDSAGRSAVKTSGFGASGNTITLSGVSNSYSVTWGTNSFSDSPSYTLGSKQIDGLQSCPAPMHDVDFPGGNPLGITVVALPNGTSYQILYDSTSKRIGEIIYPTGGWVKYEWGPNRLSDLTSFPSSQVNPVTGPPCEDRYDTVAVIHRYVSYDGTNVALQQDFSYSTTWDTSTPTVWDTKQTIITTHDLVQGITYNTVYNYTSTWGIILPNSTAGFGNLTPLEQSIVYKSPSGSALRTVTEAWDGPGGVACRLVTLDNGLISGTFYTYGTGAVVTDKKEYDYGIITSLSGCQPGSVAPPKPITSNPPSSAPTRETKTTYQSFADTPIFAAAPSILDRPSSVIIYGNGSREAETDYTYDSGVSSVSAIDHDETNYSASFTLPRGNIATETRQCIQPAPACSSGNPKTSYTYDETGQTTSMTDAKNNQTLYSYADSYTDTTPPGSTNTYLTKTTYPQTNGVNHIQSFSYAYLDGQLTVSNDQNGQSTTYSYNDPLRRLKQTNYPDGGQTIFTYADTYLGPSITTERLISSGNYLSTISVMDGLGHVVKSELTSDSSTDYTITAYDGLGHVHTVTNPYRSTSDPTYGVTTYSYDALGRTTQVTHPDNSKLLTSYTGRAAETTDEGNGTKSVQRITQTDALGRITSVCEVSSATQMGSSGTPGNCGQDIAATGFLTAYPQYDALDDLLQVNQSSLGTRTFAYNSLSQLTSATNPESGVTTYTYDADGNLATRTQPEPNQTSASDTVATTYVYDALNRMTAQQYSDATDNVDYNYDETSPWGFTLTNQIGRLTTEYDANTGNVFSYDPMGRVVQNHQCTPQNCGSGDFPIAYTYDGIGDITSSTDGQYNLFTDTYNNAAQLTKLVSSYSDANHPGNLFSSVIYNAPGQVTSALLGNGITESRGYNSRLEMTSASAGSVYSVSLGYAPNGDLTSANDSVNGNWTYSNDDFNRLSGSSCSSHCPNGENTQGFSYSYDRFGNRWDQNVTAGSGGTLDLTFTGNNNHIDGYSYDAAGNLMSDGSHTYYYDAEHHLVQVDGSAGWCQSDTGTAATECYTYDAEGRRVRRAIPGSGITDDYLYDLSGHLITQVTSSGFWVRDEIYANRTHIATYENDLQTPTTFFTHGDHLGTERVETAVNGSSCETITNTAFGDGLNTSGSCDPTELRFTGQPRDWETNLDYFGARFYSSQFGRFNSTDPENAGASDDDPQSWNGYSYVRGSVLNATDPDGLDCIYINNDTGQYEGFNTGDCDNSTTEKANSGYYVNGAVNTIYTTTGDTSGVVTGFDATNDSGATIVGAFVPDTNSNNNRDDLLNAVAQGTQMSRPIVEPAFWATMGFLGAVGPGILESSLALPSAGLTIPGGGLVIGKMRALGDLAAGERTLSDRGQMPNQGSYQGNAVQNASRLRFEMSRGEPIRDASAGNYDESNFGFLKLERNILRDHGWKLSSDGYWYPPNK